MGMTLQVQGAKLFVNATTSAALVSAITAARPGTVVTLTEQVDPFTLTLTAAKAAPGIVVVLPAAQVLKLVVSDLANANTTILGGTYSADTVNGGIGFADNTATNIYLLNSSKIAIRGATYGQGSNGLFASGCTDIMATDILHQHARGDVNHINNCQRVHLDRYYSREPNIFGQQILWYNNGTPPVDGVADTSNGTTSFWADTAHSDLAQVHKGSTDIKITNFDVQGLLQGLVSYSSDPVTHPLRMEVTDNNLLLFNRGQVDITGGDLTISRNTVGQHPFNPSYVPLIRAVRDGSGRVQGYGNVAAAGDVTSPASVDLAAGSLNGDASVVLPTAPALNVLPWQPAFSRPTYTARSTPPVVVVPPALYHTDAAPGSPPTTGTYITVGMGGVAGGEGATGQEWRWTKNGTPSGSSARVYQVVGGDLGAAIRCETRVQNGFGWSAWVASAALTPA